MGDGNLLAFPLMNGLTVATLRATLDTLEMKVAVIGPSGRIVLANEAWRTSTDGGLGLCGRGPGESFLTNLEQSVMRRADALRLRRAVTEVLASRRSRFSFECRLRTRSSRTWFSIDVTRFDVGGWVHARVEVEEITMTKMMQRSHAASEQRVRRIKGKMVEHERTIARLRECERLKDEFIATVAHELRNPLAPIVNAAEVLTSNGTDQHVTVRACEVICRQVRMLTRLVDDLFDISRMVRGNVELRREPLDLQGVIATAIETARPLIDQQRHTLAIRMRKQPLVVDGDPSRLAQIVANLLNNAAKYTNPGGRITLIAARIGDVTVVRVRDTGIGIRHEHLERMFELFVQAEPRSKRTLGGLGVGLALARQLAERHGGSLTGHSNGPGRGSEFTLALPNAERHMHDQAATSVRERAGPRRGQSLRRTGGPARGATHASHR